MTNFDYDLFIVGAFGRGQKLASEAHKLGLKTAFLDLTGSLGTWSCEDFEGPFGSLGLEEFPDWRIRLGLDGHLQEQEVGLCIWRDSGPFEFKGPLGAFHLREQHELRRRRMAARGSTLSSVGFFEDSWIRYLDHYWGATRELSFQDVSRWVNEKTPESKGNSENQARLSHETDGFVLPGLLAPRLRQSFCSRRLNPSDYEKGLDHLRTLGVTVSYQSRLQDVTLGTATEPLFGIETAGEWVGLARARAGAWLLTSEETHFLSESAGRAIYPRGVMEPECCWLRYAIQIIDSELGKKFPQHFVMLGDVNQFWMRDNFMIVQKTLLAEVCDVWVKIPFVQRFNSDYLRETGDAILQAFRQRVGPDRVILREHPREFQFTYQQLGPARFPVFREKTALTSRINKTVLRSSPDQWTHYGWTERARSEGDDLQSLVQMIQRRKEKQSDRAVHTS